MSEEQLTEIRLRLPASGMSEKQLLEMMKVPNLIDIPAATADRVIARLIALAEERRQQDHSQRDGLRVQIATKMERMTELTREQKSEFVTLVTGQPDPSKRTTLDYAIALGILHLFVTGHEVRNFLTDPVRSIDLAVNFMPTMETTPQPPAEPTIMPEPPPVKIGADGKPKQDPNDPGFYQRMSEDGQKLIRHYTGRGPNPQHPQQRPLIG